MVDPPTWHDVLDVSDWTPTGTVDVVMGIYDSYDKLPKPHFPATQ